MPNYNAQNPPYAMFPGDVVFAFNSESPAAGQASQQFSLPVYSGQADQGRTVRWQTLYGSAPTAIAIALQVSLQDVDAQYQTVDTSTNTAGESRSVSGINAPFIRAKVTAITGGSGVTVQITA